MRCPKCRTVELKPTRGKRTGTELDYCPQCRGIWFDTGEFESACRHAAKDLQGDDDWHEVARMCPRCEEFLYQFIYPQTLVAVDMCPHCQGLWLDAGETKEIESLRSRWKEIGKLQEYAEIPGIKGKLIRLINRAIDSLNQVDERI